MLRFEWIFVLAFFTSIGLSKTVAFPPEPSPIQCNVFNGSAIATMTCHPARMGLRWGSPTCLTVYSRGRASERGYQCIITANEGLRDCKMRCPYSIVADGTKTCCCYTDGCNDTKPPVIDYSQE